MKRRPSRRSSRIAARSAHGYTIAEMTILCVVVGIVASLAFIPASATEGVQADSAGRQFAQMIEYVQSLAIARPDNAYIIKVDQTANRFWAALASAPDTPLTQPIKNQPYLVQLGQNSTSGLKNLTITGYDFGGDNIISFDSTGSMDQDTPARLQISVSGRTVTINAAPVSGLVQVDNVSLSTTVTVGM